MYNYKLYRIKCCLQQIEINITNNAHSYYDLGILKYELGKYFEAYMLFKMAVELDKNSSMFYKKFIISEYKIYGDLGSPDFELYKSNKKYNNFDDDYNKALEKFQLKESDDYRFKFLIELARESTFFYYEVANAKAMYGDHACAILCTEKLISLIGVDSYIAYDKERNNLK